MFLCLLSQARIFQLCHSKLDLTDIEACYEQPIVPLGLWQTSRCVNIMHGLGVMDFKISLAPPYHYLMLAQSSEFCPHLTQLCNIDFTLSYISSHFVNKALLNIFPENDLPDLLASDDVVRLPPVSNIIRPVQKTM